MKSRRQALSLCLDSAVIVVIKIFNEFPLKVFYGFKVLQIKQFTFERSKEAFYHSVVQTVPLLLILLFGTSSGIVNTPFAR